MNFNHSTHHWLIYMNQAYSRRKTGNMANCSKFLKKFHFAVENLNYHGKVEELFVIEFSHLKNPHFYIRLKTNDNIRVSPLLRIFSAKTVPIRNFRLWKIEEKREIADDEHCRRGNSANFSEDAGFNTCPSRNGHTVQRKNVTHLGTASITINNG